MNCCTARLLYRASGATSRFLIVSRRGIAYISIDTGYSMRWYVVCRFKHYASSTSSALLPLFGGCTPGLLRAILRTSLLTVCDTLCIQCAAHDVVTYTGQVFDATTADE